MISRALYKMADDIVGPMPAEDEGPPAKKKKGKHCSDQGVCRLVGFMRAADDGPPGSAVALAHERLYLEKLPSASMYERSYMHRDVVTHVSVTRWVPSTALLIACRT